MASSSKDWPWFDAEAHAARVKAVAEAERLRREEEKRLRDEEAAREQAE